MFLSSPRWADELRHPRRAYDKEGRETPLTSCGRHLPGLAPNLAVFVRRPTRVSEPALLRPRWNEFALRSFSRCDAARHFGVAWSPWTPILEELPLPRFLMVPTLAALLGSVLLPSSAQAQFGVEIGPRGPRLYEEREPPPRYIERRRRVIEEDYDDCRWIIRRYTNRFGERVERRERVCD